MLDTTNREQSKRQAAATALAVRRAIDRQLDELIRTGSAHVAKLKGSRMEENQIRNLANVASATDSQEVVTNFIRYQIGRDSGGTKWGKATGFGKALIDDIETGSVDMAVKAVLLEVPDADAVSVRAQVVRLYLGYLNRRFVHDKSGWEAEQRPRQGGKR